MPTWARADTIDKGERPEKMAFEWAPQEPLRASRGYLVGTPRHVAGACLGRWEPGAAWGGLGARGSEFTQHLVPHCAAVASAWDLTGASDQRATWADSGQEEPEWGSPSPSAAAHRGQWTFRSSCESFG